MSFHICNDWQLMEDVVEDENRTTTASNSEQQTGNLFGKVNVIVQSGKGKRIITLNDVMYIAKSPCSLVSEGKFYLKGLYLDVQQNVIRNGSETIVNYPRLVGVNVRVLQIHPDNKTID
jgi:hypothetical protein